MSNPRSLARRCAVQALYQWQLSGTNLGEIERQFLEELGMTQLLYRRHRAGQHLDAPEKELLEELLERYCFAKNQDQGEAPNDESTLDDLVRQCWAPDLHAEYFKDLLHSVPRELDRIDAAIGEFSDRAVGDIDPVERAILRLGTYELLYCPELPYRVAVNEAINLAKDFGATQSHKYVNGILDRVARKHRPLETGPRPRR